MYNHRSRRYDPYYWTVPNSSLLLYSVAVAYHHPEVEFQAGWGGLFFPGYSVPRTDAAYEYFVFSANVPLKPVNVGVAFRLPTTKAARDFIDNAICSRS